MMTFADAEKLLATARNPEKGKPLANNTRLVPWGPDRFAILFHHTYVVTIHRDGTYTLCNEGWDTATTKQRINEYGPARVYSAKLPGDYSSRWYIWHDSDVVTPPKMHKCRTCHGQNHYYAEDRCYGPGWDYTKPGYPKLAECAHGEKYAHSLGVHRHECRNCNGTGLVDVGSKQVPHVFSWDGVRVDGTGRVLDENTEEYLSLIDRVGGKRASTRKEAKR